MAQSDESEWTISRPELVAIVTACASKGCAQSTRRKLIEVAEVTDAVAVGWFFCDNGTHCPASQAGRRNQSFQTAYDFAMCERFGVDLMESREMPFSVKVVDR